MQVETRFLRLFKPVTLGDRIDGWRVCWVGGWDKCLVIFVVMVERPLTGFNLDADVTPDRPGAQ